jgi:hypothetical integral membrane protein (TIGR02206 family)
MASLQAARVVPTIETFSSPWWQTSGATIVFTVAMLFALRLLRPDQRAAYARALGWLLLLWMTFPPITHALAGRWHVDYSLPLQWCDLTGGIAGLALLTRRQLLYEVSLFWGITGAGSALLTPQFTQGTDWFYLVEFFVSHCILLTAPFYLSIYGGMRPRTWSWVGAAGWLNAAALVVGAFDVLTDTNYMFLLHAPNADLPLYKIDWPYYLIGFELACLVAFVLIYLPFRLIRPGLWWAGSEAAPGTPLQNRV